MLPRDLPGVLSIASVVHPSFPEDEAVFSERRELYPAGAYVLDDDGTLSGYLIGHPWRRGAPPPLNSLLGRLPSPADTFYLHDLALLPAARGTGAARAIVERIVVHALASGFPSLSLIAVNDSATFWSRFGFRVDGNADKDLRSYGDDARFMTRDIG